MIETALITAVEQQGIVAIILVFFIIRSEAQHTKCLDQHYEINTQLLLMLGDVLCDNANTEMCKKFEVFKVDMEKKLAFRRSRGNSYDPLWGKQV